MPYVLDVFKDRIFCFIVDGQHPVLEASVSSVELKTSRSEAVWAATGTLGSVQVMMHTVGQ